MLVRKIYKNIRQRLPLRTQATVSKIVFRFSGKPFVKRDSLSVDMKFPDAAQGGMIISADFELAWAWRYAKKFKNPMEIAIEKAWQARNNFPILIQLFERYNIPITWATVGHLFLEKCDKNDHRWMKRIPYFENQVWRYESGDWFDADPATDWFKAKEWYAPDLIKAIIESKVNHEIASHTFSHIDFSDKNSPPKVADDEISACIQAMKPYGVVPKSVVFPGGTWGNISTLKKSGIDIYRKNIGIDLSYPYFDEFGLLVSPSSLGFGRNHETWDANYYIFRCKKYIDKAIKTGTIAHFWFHPSVDEWTLKNVIPKVMDYSSEKRKEGLLWIGTMKQISDHIKRSVR